MNDGIVQNSINPNSLSLVKWLSPTLSSLDLYLRNKSALESPMTRDRHQCPQVRVLNVNTQVLREKE